MTKISEQSGDNGFLADELGSDPSTPAAGTRRIYPKDDGWYEIDDAGAVTGPFGTGAGAASAALVTIASFTPSSGATESIAFDTEVRDDGDYWVVGAPTRLTVPATGWYVINGQVSTVGATNTDSVEISIRQDGTTVIGQTRDYESTNSITRHNNVGSIVYLSASAYVELRVAFAAEAVSARFGIAKVG